MGKKTLYHPISLNIIRGGFDYCGAGIARIQRVSMNDETRRAFYKVTLNSYPKEWASKGPGRLMQIVQGCFMDDVRITGVYIHLDGDCKAPAIAFDIMTQALSDEPAQPEEDANQIPF